MKSTPSGCWSVEIERFEDSSRREEQSKVLLAIVLETALRGSQGQDQRTMNKALKTKYHGKLVRTRVPRTDWGSESCCQSPEIYHLSDALC